MPYVNRESRAFWRAEAAQAQQMGLEVQHRPEGSMGVMNYLISLMVDGFLGPSPSYARFNEAIGLLESVKLELYRRRVAPYEDTKIAENGDLPAPPSGGVNTLGV